MVAGGAVVLVVVVAGGDVVVVVVVGGGDVVVVVVVGGGEEAAITSNAPASLFQCCSDVHPVAKTPTRTRWRPSRAPAGTVPLRAERSRLAGGEAAVVPEALVEKREYLILDKISAGGMGQVYQKQSIAR